MNQNTLEGGGQLHSDNQGTVKTKSVFSRLIAGLIASVMALAGLVAIGPAAYAQTPGISITALHNNSPISQGQVFQPGDNLTLRVQYDRAVDSASPVVVDLPQGVTFDDASLEVPSGNTAIEDISHVNGSVHISFYEPSDWEMARLAAHVMSQELNSGEAVKAATLKEFQAMANNLMTTEGARRRLRVELQRGPRAVEDRESDEVMDTYRGMFDPS